MTGSILGSDYQLEKLSTGQEGNVVIKVQKIGKPDLTLTFDKTTAYLIELDYDLSRNGRTIGTHILYSGYQNFSGLMFPTTIKYSEGTDIESVSKIASVEALESFPEPPIR